MEEDGVSKMTLILQRQTLPIASIYKQAIFQINFLILQEDKFSSEI